MKAGLQMTLLWTLGAMVGCSTSGTCGLESGRALVEASGGSPIEAAIARGVAFLKRSQNADGSWGTGLETRGLEIYSMVPGSHDAYRVATTALCVMALREVGEKEAHGRGVEYLVTQGQARRDDGSILYNVWAHTYVLQAMAIEMRHGRDPRLKEAALWHLERLERYQTYMGGWNYYDFRAHTQVASMGPTSFNAAAGLVAMWEARKSGIEVPQRMIDLCIRRLEEMRLPNGAYLYSADMKYLLRLPANKARGSVGRTQSCNDALWLWGSATVGRKETWEGMEVFFAEHDWLNMGRRRPLPHESWYQTSGYYYYFGHYHAARLIERLGPEAKKAFGAKFASKILPHQEPDGSWWDYAMWDYHKPYGTAFALMSLLRVCGVDESGLTELKRGD